MAMQGWVQAECQVLAEEQMIWMWLEQSHEAEF